MWKPPAPSMPLNKVSASPTKQPPTSKKEKEEALQDAASKQEERAATLEKVAELHPNPIYGDRELFHKGIESIIDIAIYTIDTEGIVRSWSPSAARIKGYELEEILGQHYSKFYSEEQVKSGFLDFERHEAREKGHYVNNGWRSRRDGTQFWAEEIITPIYGDANELLGYCKTTRDLSAWKQNEERLTGENRTLTANLQKQVLELQATNQRLEHEIRVRKKAEENLIISEKRYRKLIEITQSIVWTMDAGGHFTVPQSSWEQFTGQTWEQYNHLGWVNAVHPEDREASLQAWRQAVQTATPYHASYRLWFREGYYRHIIAHAAPLFNQEGQVSEWIGSCADVHALRQTEEKLRQVTERLELALQASGIGVGEWDIAADKVHWDEQHCKLFGLTSQTFAATYAAFLEMIHPNDRAYVAVAMEKSLKEGIDFNTQFRVIWPDNSIHVIASRAKVCYANQSAPQSLMGVSWDITQQKRLEEERLQAITSAELYQRERAQAAENHKAEIQELMHRLCHEIRNPLTGIQGMIDWLDDIQTHVHQLIKNFNALLSEPNQLTSQMQLNIIREALASIHKGLLEIIEVDKEAVSHLNDVVTDVLENAKIEAGKLNINHVIFEPKNIINAIVKLQSSNKLRISKGLNIQVDMPEEEILLKGDPAKLKIIILNLVTNAIKYTEQGSVTIVLKYQPLASDKTELQVSVTDTGVGISENERKQLFQNFTQVGSRVFKPSGGSGLGLSIVKGYINAMGGKMTIESQKNQGSTFYITIPCDNVSNEEKHKYKQQFFDIRTNERLSLNEASLHRKNILIVEDNVVNQRILKKMLDKLGHNSHTVSNGKEAVAIIERGEQHFDAILMDIEMPIMNGLEATKLIRQKEQLASSTKTIPILGLSAHANADDKANALALGMNDYICKPIKTEEVAIKIERWTNNVALSESHLRLSNELPKVVSTALKEENTSSTPILPTLFKPLKTRITKEVQDTDIPYKKQKTEPQEEEKLYISTNKK